MDEEKIKVKRSGRRLVNCVKKLQTMEIDSSKRSGGFKFSEERFRNIQLQGEYHMYDPEEYLPFTLPFLNQRTKITKLFATSDIVFVLAESGLCTTFSRETRKRICFINVSPNEAIRDLFYNERNDSVITISRCPSDSRSPLVYRTTSINYIRRGEPNASLRLFESESVKWPIVEFDDVNGKIIMYFSEDKLYKVFDLKNFALVYTILDKKIQKIKISPGFLLLVYKRTHRGIPLKIVSVEDGAVIKSFSHPLHKNKKVVLIQQFNEKLLLKQTNQNLQIVDVQNSEVLEISQTEFLTPSSFLFCHKNQLFLTFTVWNRTFTVWNLRGKLVTSLEDHVIWYPYYNIDRVYLTSNGELIIVSTFGNANSINVSNIESGKCVRKITQSNSNVCIQTSRIRSTVARALEDITFITYDEERNEIFTGNNLGQVYVWTN